VLATSALVLAFTGYAAVTSNAVLAAVGQVFAGLSVVAFFKLAGSDSLSWPAALAPLGAVALLSLGGRRWAEAYGGELPSAQTVRRIAAWYGWTAMALTVWWTFEYAATRQLVVSYSALGAAALAVAGWRRNREFLVFAAVLNGCAAGSLASQILSGAAVYWLNFVSVLAWMAEQQLARRQAERFAIPAAAHNVVMVGAGVLLWWLTSRWVAQGFSGFYLTASWSAYAFAILATGMALRERMYRWLGLGILGAALARVVIFDVWKLDTLYRILSFFALGLVLLVLGFIYNKYQERIRQWL
jgi:hypothetical protein